MKKAIIVVVLLVLFIFAFSLLKGPQKAENKLQAEVAASSEEVKTPAESYPAFIVGKWYTSFNNEETVYYILADHTYRRCAIKSKKEVCEPEEKWYLHNEDIYTSGKNESALEIDTLNEWLWRPLGGARLRLNKY